jgi:hypothetical protein
MIPTTRGSSALLMSIPPNAYDYSTWTADTPTNITETLLTGANGPSMRFVSATATTRGGGRYTMGTRISAQVRSYGYKTASAAPLIAGAIYLARPGTDSRRLVLCCETGGLATGALLYLLLYTDKDTYSAARLTQNIDYATGIAMRLGSRAGTTTAEVSVDGGANWESIYSAADATAFGSAGAGTHVGVGLYSASTGSTINVYAPYALVEA